MKAQITKQQFRPAYSVGKRVKDLTKPLRNN